MLLSAVVPVDESLKHLVQAVDMCNEISKTHGPSKRIDHSLWKITRLRVRYEELQREKGRPKLGEDEGRAEVDSGAGTADDRAEELLSQAT